MPISLHPADDAAPTASARPIQARRTRSVSRATHPLRAGSEVGLFWRSPGAELCRRCSGRLRRGGRRAAVHMLAPDPCGWYGLRRRWRTTRRATRSAPRTPRCGPTCSSWSRSRAACSRSATTWRRPWSAGGRGRGAAGGRRRRLLVCARRRRRDFGRVEAGAPRGRLDASPPHEVGRARERWARDVPRPAGAAVAQCVRLISINQNCRCLSRPGLAPRGAYPVTQGL